MIKKHKKIFILLIGVSIMFVLVILLNTRVVYWHNVYWEHELPNKTDAEYLELYDLRFIFNNSNDDKVKKLGLDLVNESFKNNGEVPLEYAEIISSELFKEINPRGFLSKHKSDILNEEFIIKDTDVIVHNDKAIFFFGYTYHASYYDGQKSSYGQGYEGYPNRIYFKLENGKWIVQSVFTTN